MKINDDFESEIKSAHKEMEDRVKAAEQQLINLANHVKPLSEEIEMLEELKMTQEFKIRQLLKENKIAEYRLEVAMGFIRMVKDRVKWQEDAKLKLKEVITLVNQRPDALQ